MARPTKQGLDYFPFDVGFFGDQKIRILKARYGADGIAVYVKLLCDVYKEGYFLPVDDWADYVFVMSDEIGATVDKVEQIITFLRNRAMIRVYRESELTGYEWDAVITSHGIQKRYAEALKSRKKGIEEIKRGFWLLTEKEEAEIKAFYKSAKNGSFSENNPDKSENNPNKSEKNAIKESKVICTDVPRARGEFFKEFPQVQPKASETADFEGIDFDKLKEKFRQSKKLLQTRRAWSWVTAHYEKILAGEYDDFPEAEKPERPAASVPPSVEAANARSERERWYSARHNAAEAKAEKAKEKARSFPAYLEAEKALKRLEIEHAKAELYEPEKVKDIELEQEAREFERAQALLLAGLTEAELLPVWHCARCSDTGFLLSGAVCDCYEKAHPKK